MNKIISSVDIEINGARYPALEVKPLEETYRSRVQLMNGQGYIDNETEYGLEISFSESKVEAFTPSRSAMKSMTNGTVTIVYDDGSREIYNGCVVLGRARSGYSPNNGATVNFTLATNEPISS